MAATPSQRIDTLRERIKIEAGQLSPADAEANHPGDSLERYQDRTIDAADAEKLIDFSDTMFMLSSEYSDHRHEKLLRHTTLIAERCGGLAAALTDRESAEDILTWINRRYDNEETNQDYRVAVRVFGRRVTDDGVNGPDTPPKSIDWIPSGTSNNYDPKPDPTQMLEWETDVQDMIDAASTEKEAAAIALQFDAGLRGGEFKDLTADQFGDGKYGLQVTVHGKQGQRTVTLIPSVPYVRKWLEAHPGGESAPLWCKRRDGDTRVSDKTIYNWFEKAAADAGVSKDVTLTNFRKSSASFMASRGMNQAHLEQRYGWVRGSKTASRYVSVFAEDSEIETAKVWGKEIDTDEEPDPMDPVDCPRCDKETPREKDMCVWCGQALEPGTAEVADAIEGELLDSIRDADSDEQIDQRVGLLEQFRESPEQRAELVDELADSLANG